MKAGSMWKLVVFAWMSFGASLNFDGFTGKLILSHVVNEF